MSLRETMQNFSAHPTVTLAVFCERNRAQLQANIGVPGIVYAGNLGLEISGDGLLFVEPTAAANVGELAELKKRLELKLRDHAETRVENNGLALDIRVAEPDTKQSEEVRRLIHETLASANYPFHLETRADAYQISPRVAWSKIDAINWIKEQINPKSLILYLSADENDIDATTPLQEAIRVKVGAGETLAPYWLDGPAQLVSFLKWLTREFPKEPRTQQGPCPQA